VVHGDLTRVVVALASLALGVVVAQPPPAVRPLYDSDSAHLWNRVHDSFQVRIAPDGTRHGLDTIDPLLWRETKHLLKGESHARATAVLDEFLAVNGERLIRDPLRRAVFQNDLWSIFDWLVTSSDGDMDARRTLMSRLVRVMRRVALGEHQIGELPDTYALAVGASAGTSDSPSSLPRDLVSAPSGWTAIGGTQPIVPQHAGELGRSAFIVLWRLPGGESATRAYLQKLWEFPQPFVPDGSFNLPRDGEMRVKLNPALPPVPDGTRLALVRLMLLIDDRGSIRPTHVVQSVQLRTIRGNPAFAEWRMSRHRLFAGIAGGLQPVGPEDREFLTFSSHGIDPFERVGSAGKFEASRVLEMCPHCHQTESAPAIETIRSVPSLLRPYTFSDSRHERWSRWFTQPIVAAGTKARTYEWGVLTTLWNSR
jgi:hypothetical protein